MDQYYYFATTQETYSAYQMQTLFGIDVSTMSVPLLNWNNFYPVQPSSPDFDVKLYDPSSSWSIIPIAPAGEGAIRVYTPVPKPLPDAKANASAEAKSAANSQIEDLCATCGFSNEVLTAVASQDPASRAARYQEELDEMTAITDKLDSDLTAIDTATSVDEINNIVNKPTGIIFTGRGSGLGPEDLNPSYYVEFNSVSLTPEQTELYVPGTATVIPYTTELPPPYTFDSMGDCFNEGDYLMQIRETATSMVIAEFEVPLNAEGQDVSF